MWNSKLLQCEDSISSVSENVEELITNKIRVKGIGYRIKWVFYVYIGRVKTEIK